MGCVQSQNGLKTAPEVIEIDESDGKVSQWERQTKLGPQSFRGDPNGQRSSRLTQVYVVGDAHREACFKLMTEREQDYCGDWAVFYHSYSVAAVIYEVQAAIAAVCLGITDCIPPLPRLLGKDFSKTPDVHSIISQIPKFEKESPGMADHHPDFRKVIISSMCSLMSSGPEVCIAKIFGKGYSCKGLPYQKLLTGLLQECHVAQADIDTLVYSILELATRYSLDASKFGGKPAEEATAGHLLQVFIKRDLVDRLAYAANPYGSVDASRMPMKSWLSGSHSFSRGQARLLANPGHFLHEKDVKVFVHSADPSYHAHRPEFQTQLRGLLEAVLEPSQRAMIAREICPGASFGHDIDFLI